jgi:DNA-binding transcriptional regulator YhcF (GntR family)
VSVSESDESGRRKSTLVYNTLMSWLAEGKYGERSQLPTQRKLADDLGVSRDTVQKVMRQLEEEGYISLTQGSGSTVLKVPETESTPQGRPQLYHSMHQAFKRSEVSLDVFALTAESFVGHFDHQVGRVEAGELALSKVAVRILLPSEHLELAYPRAWDPADKRPWLRWRNMARGNARKMERCRDRLSARGVTLDLRIHRVKLTPAFKLYVINGSTILHGLYHPVRAPIEFEDGTVVEDAVDVKGVGVSLEQYRAGGEEFDRHREWFKDHWTLSSVEEPAAD